jgi:hypothetical protein
MKEQITLGRWTGEKLDLFLKKSSQIHHTGSQIDFISRQFLNTDYKESTLTGDINTPEILVMNLEKVDCFTLLDYVEAMRLSESFSDFKENLKRVRYRSGKVVFENRNHFFTDWQEYNAGCIENITGQINIQNIKTVKKLLNKKEDGASCLQGILPRERTIQYIASEDIDHSLLFHLETGDYVGIYSALQGLDVSHVGIVVKDRGEVYLRHASSKQRKVVDEVLRQYVSEKPGLIVLRPKEIRCEKG